MEKITLISIFLFQFFICFNTSQVIGQSKDDKQWEVLKNKEKDLSLIVLLPKRDAKFEEKATKKGDAEVLANYRKQLLELHSDIKEAVSIVWKLNENPIQFKTYEDFLSNKLSISEMSKSIIFSLANSDYDIKKDGAIDYELPYVGIVIESDNPKKKEASKETFVDVTYIANKGKPTKLDIIFGVQQLQNNLRAFLDGGNERLLKEKDAEQGKSMSILKKNMLLIDNSFLKDGLTEKNIKTFYPFPFKIVNKADIESAIIKQEPNTFYVALLPRQSPYQNAPIPSYTKTKQTTQIGIHTYRKEFTLCIVDANDGKILTNSSSRKFAAGSIWSEGDTKIDLEDIKNFAKVVKAGKE